MRSSNVKLKVNTYSNTLNKINQVLSLSLNKQDPKLVLLTIAITIVVASCEKLELSSH